MSRRRKTEIEDLPSPAEIESVDVEEASAAPEVPMLSFSHWFDKMLKKGKVRHYQDEALLVFFKKQGLKNIEMEDTYNKTFKSF